jgi:hypothetical protein
MPYKTVAMEMYGRKKMKSAADEKVLVSFAPDLPKVKQLRDGHICIRQKQTGDFVVFLTRHTLKRHQRFNQILFLTTPVLHICGKFSALIPKDGHEKGDDRHSHTNDNELEKATVLGVIYMLHSPYGQMLVGGIEHGANKMAKKANPHEANSPVSSSADQLTLSA